MVIEVNNQIDGIVVTKLRIIKGDKGAVYHGLKTSEKTFKAFGEAYFSRIEPGVIKGWKTHRLATLNIIVPFGGIEFVLYDDRENSRTRGNFRSVILSADSEELYHRLTVPPGIWMAFRTINKGFSILLDIIDIEHTDEESDQKSISEIYYPW